METFHIKFPSSRNEEWSNAQGTPLRGYPYGQVCECVELRIICEWEKTLETGLAPTCCPIVINTNHVKNLKLTSFN